MEPQEKHSMMLAQTYPSGAEEWVCPTCGLRFVMQWPPAFKKIILQEGDPQAIHSGGKGGVEMGTPQIRPADQLPETPEETQEGIDENALGPWVEFLQDINVSDQLDDSVDAK